LVGTLSVIGLVFASFACSSGLNDIDRRVQRVLNERSGSLGADAPPPHRTFGDPAKRPDSALNKRPDTTNPDASDLTYTPADEARDVAGRLRAYADAATGKKTPDQVRRITLNESFRIGQQSASEYLTAEEEYISAAIDLLIERHLWSPRFFNDTTASISGSGSDGDFQHAARIVNNFRVSKRLPYGGDVEAQWVWQATEQLREQATGRYTQSSELVFAGNVPLLRGAGYVAQESLIQAERNLVYQARNFEQFRRNFLVDIAADYFSLLQSRAQITNQEARIESLRRIEAQQTAFFEAGRVAEFERNIAANDVLDAIETLASQEEAYILELDRFKIRLGLSPETVIELDPEILALPDPESTLEEATEMAMSYRLDLQNRRDQLDDSRRAVANAQNNTLPDLNLDGRVGIPTDPTEREGGLLFQPGELNYQAGVTLGLPLDREIDRLRLRQATINYQSRERDYLQFRDDIAVTVRRALRNVDLARFQLRLAEERVKINERRVKETQLKADQVNTQTQVDAANNLQQSQNSADQARTLLRNAILAYLNTSGQLRVARDGTFLPLTGMPTGRNAQPPPPAPDALPPLP
jgi:outer membrane protein TolC